MPIGLFIEFFPVPAVLTFQGIAVIITVQTWTGPGSVYEDSGREAGFRVFRNCTQIR